MNYDLRPNTRVEQARHGRAMLGWGGWWLAAAFAGLLRCFAV